MAVAGAAFLTRDSVFFVYLYSRFGNGDGARLERSSVSYKTSFGVGGRKTMPERQTVDKAVQVCLFLSLNKKEKRWRGERWSGWKEQPLKLWE